MTRNYEIFRYLVRQGDVGWRLYYDLDFSFRAFFAILDLGAVTKLIPID